MSKIIEKARKWLSDSFDIDTQKQINYLINHQPEKLNDCFYKDLSFGTGGMRGIVGLGTNRINKYTLGKATQGLSNYLKKKYPNQEIKVVIAYDCRNDSKWLSTIVSNILSANNIKVFIFDDIRPTPELSFAVTYLKCHAGIVLTASHNPPEYNGYKVYWNDGGQIVPPHNNKIISEVKSIDFSHINFNSKQKLITEIGNEIDEAFWKESLKNGKFDVIGRENLKIVFTPLHGTSIKLIPEILKRAGYTNVHIVKEQSIADGNFSTVKSPNPEEPEALKTAIKIAEETNADIVIGTDPDSDRLGIAVRDLNNNIILLNGNQTMSIMTNFLIKKWKLNNKLNGKQFIGSTIVSTDLVKEIAMKNNVEFKVCLTGFKWIAKMIKDYPNLEFIGGGEESYGYMIGDFVRDKDAVTSTLLACEIAADSKSKNGSLFNDLIDIYIKNNFYKEHLVSLVKKGISGDKEIKQIMFNLRQKPFEKIDGEKIKFLYDYKSSICKNILNKTQSNIKMPKSDVLIYETINGTKVACRPSGTEPKIKFYISVKTKLKSKNDFDEKNKKLSDKILRICNELNL